MELTNCTHIYWEFIRALRNDKRTQSGFIQKEYITKEAQEIYMKLNASNYKIALLNGSPVGYVGVIDNDIRVCTHPDYQGKGLGKQLIQSLINQSEGHKKIILYANPGKEGFYTKLGFRQMNTAMAIFQNENAMMQNGILSER